MEYGVIEAKFYQKGDSLWVNEFSEFLELFRVCDAFEKIQEKYVWINTDGDEVNIEGVVNLEHILDQNVIRFTIQPIRIGSYTNEFYMSELENELDNRDANYLLSPYAKELFDIALALRTEHLKKIESSFGMESFTMSVIDNPLPVTYYFLTAWKVESGQEPDNWIGPGEYYTNFTFMGLIDLQNLI